MDSKNNLVENCRFTYPKLQNLSKIVSNKGIDNPELEENCYQGQSKTLKRQADNDHKELHKSNKKTEIDKELHESSNYDKNC